MVLRPAQLVLATGMSGRDVNMISSPGQLAAVIRALAVS